MLKRSAERTTVGPASSRATSFASGAYTPIKSRHGLPVAPSLTSSSTVPAGSVTFRPLGNGSYRCQGKSGMQGKRRRVSDAATCPWLEERCDHSRHVEPGNLPASPSVSTSVCVLDIELDLKIPQRQEPTLSSRPSAKAASRRSHSRAPETGVRDSDNLPKAATG